MTTTTKVTAVIGLLALSGLAIRPVLAQGEPPQGPPRMHRMGPGGAGFGAGPGGRLGLLGDLGRGLRQLGITDEQREQIRGVMTSHQPAFKEIGDRLRAAREGMDALITADVVDEAAIRAKSAEVAAVQADAAVLRARVHQETFALLTAEQQAKAKELRAAAKERLEARGERRREGRAERRERRHDRF